MAPRLPIPIALLSALSALALAFFFALVGLHPAPAQAQAQSQATPPAANSPPPSNPAVSPSPTAPSGAPSTVTGIPGGSVAVWMSGSGGGYTATLDAMRAELARHGISRVVAAAPTTASAEVDMRKSWPTDAQLLVTVGAQATRQALAQDDLRLPILAILLPRLAFEDIMAGARPVAGRRVSAIFIDQPASRQLDLLRLVLPQARRVAAIAGPSGQRDTQRLQAAAESRGLDLQAELVTRPDELFASLQRGLRGVDALVVVPDAAVVNADSAQNVLLTSYRLRVPVIGYSASYARAGALAAVFSTPAQQGQEAADLARAVLRGQPLPAPRGPRLFDVAINPQIARTLGLADLDEASLRERLQRLDREGSSP